MNTFDFEAALQIRNNLAEMMNSTYIPTSKEELLSMNAFDLKCRMTLNENYCNAALALLGREVDLYIAHLSTQHKKLAGIATLDELLNKTHFFGNNYEESRDEFVGCFLEHLWDLVD